MKIFKQKGIWIEDGAITPQPGDIILFNWDDNTQPNDGYSDHIGFVESVSGRTITTIEGNKSQAVGRRTLTVGAGNIRGYARPKYSGSSSGGGSTSSSTSPKKSVSEIADEVIAGNGVTETPERTLSLQLATITARYRRRLMRNFPEAAQLLLRSPMLRLQRK